MVVNKKILNVVSVYFSIPFFFGNQLKYFSKKGYNIHLVCSPSDKIEDFANRQGVKYKEFDIRRSFSVLQDLKTVFALYKYIRKNNFDIVVGHTPKGALLSMIAGFLARTPKRIFFRHGLVYETKSGFSKILLKNIERFTSILATKVVCVSPYLIEKSKQDKLSKAEKLNLLNIGSCNGLDVLTKFNPKNISSSKLDDLKIKFNINEHNYVIGYVGRLVKDKGIPELVESFVYLRSEHKHIKLLLVGPEENKDALHPNIRNIIETNKDIISIGHVDNFIEYYYSLMNLFILPTHREGLGTSILEASAMCLPVVTAGHTGSRDAIINNVTGTYVKIDVSSIKAVLSEYILNPNRYLSQGANGRNHVVKNFQQELIWNEIEEKIYK